MEKPSFKRHFTNHNEGNMHTIERELIKITGYQAKRKFSDRQDYLKSILNAVAKLEDEDFNDLTDETAAWANAAVEAHNTKNCDIPDFDEIGDTAELDDDDDEGTSDEPEVSASKPDEEEPVVEDEPEEKVTAKPASKKAKKPAPIKTITTKAEDRDVAILDKWGAISGSKNSQALALFEKGATSKEVKEELGGTYYNILKKMVKDGHKLEKEGALIKLIHRGPNKAIAAKTSKKKK